MLQAGNFSSTKPNKVTPIKCILRKTELSQCTYLAEETAKPDKILLKFPNTYKAAKLCRNNKFFKASQSCSSDCCQYTFCKAGSNWIITALLYYDNSEMRGVSNMHRERETMLRRSYARSYVMTRSITSAYK